MTRTFWGSVSNVCPSIDPQASQAETLSARSCLKAKASQTASVLSRNGAEGENRTRTPVIPAQDFKSFPTIRSNPLETNKLWITFSDLTQFLNRVSLALKSSRRAVSVPHIAHRWFVVLIVSFLAGCATQTEYGSCVGINGDQDPKLKYEYSAWNIAMGVLFIELIIPPIFVVMDELKCPVGEKK